MSKSIHAKLIGLYGIFGCGKSFLLEKLGSELGESKFHYFEGSEEIDSITPGGLNDFKKLSVAQQTILRQSAIESIKSMCKLSGKTGIVTGHYSFWQSDSEPTSRVWTTGDAESYTHIVYVNTPVEEIVKQRQDDRYRSRPILSAQHLKSWQDLEMRELRKICYQYGILFTALFPNLKDKLPQLLLDFQGNCPELNETIVEQNLQSALSDHYDELETVIFFDSDKTLTAEDTGEIFWKKISSTEKSPLVTLFSSDLGYSYDAFRQAMLLYEESTSDVEFNSICTQVAEETKLYPQMLSLLRCLKNHNHVRLIIVTCGLRLVWEKIMELVGLSRMVKIIGGGRLTDGLVMTPYMKGLLVSRAKKNYGAYTWVFGDSPLDLPMFVMADQAVVVVGDEKTRSKSMEDRLADALENDGLQARQVLLPNSSVPPRLDDSRLPIVDLISSDLMNSIIKHRTPPGGLKLQHATDSAAANLLMTPASVKGSPLRDAHFKAGSFLAWRYLSELFGLEKVSIRHVQGNNTVGYRLLGEDKTLIVALMRGGESMAFGINDVFPEAQFLHAKEPEDIKRHHLEDNLTVILVDSVINTGSTIVKFVESVRAIHAAIRIIVVAGVIQESAVSGCGAIKSLARTTEITIVALRISRNKFTGSGGTDTGNRLFNTTYLV